MLKAAICLEDADLSMEISGLVRKAFDFANNNLSTSLTIDFYHTSKEFYKARKAYDLVMVEAWLEEGAGIGLGMFIWQVFRDTKVIMIREKEDPVSILNRTHCFGIIDRGEINNLKELLDSFFHSVKLRTGKDVISLRGEEGRMVGVMPDNLIYLSTVPGKRNRVELYLEGKESIVAVVGTFSRLVAELEPYGFITISQSCCVNPKYVMKIAKEYVTLKNGINLQISQRRSSYVREKMNEDNYGYPSDIFQRI